ncbi:hypothetical protein IMX26_02760 [Clostridium sp. 'deep sea']|uniref:hypothetical protein n=1 Tax=Clostridium sp. 'deep sea' TaxID=2779445 RepID=UPI0018966176|nr:hypothetical protein [Clostridium sp. 'deep sea']QOR35761.1 hypothetical protein IMX26_02760 [Clostridium sp. 'deep sea']
MKKPLFLSYIVTVLISIPIFTFSITKAYRYPLILILAGSMFLIAELLLKPKIKPDLLVDIQKNQLIMTLIAFILSLSFCFIKAPEHFSYLKTIVITIVTYYIVQSITIVPYYFKHRGSKSNVAS